MAGCTLKGQRSRMKQIVIAIVLTLNMGVVASAHAGDNPQDPWEGFNRKVFVFNKAADAYILKPIAKGYNWLMPDPAVRAVSNFFSNLGEPKTLINDVLQLKMKDAGVDALRFVVNTTVGVLGVFDVATYWGLEKNNEDFGLTLATWGVKSGPYVMLPFLGPSSVRDGIGLIPDYYATPQTYVENDKVRLLAYGVDVVNRRAGLLGAEALIKGDDYTFIRDVYLQHRNFLSNGHCPLNDSFLSDEDGFLSD